MRSAGLLNNGAVAQLGERQNRTLEVGSSTLLCSTKKRRGQAIFKKLPVPFFYINSYKNGTIRVSIFISAIRPSWT